MANAHFGTCGQCEKKVEGLSNALLWEAMIFCNVTCLGEPQKF
jgi:hypothetical protein